MQGEIIRIDAQLTQFISADQQVQRQLLIAEVVADDFRHECVAASAQRELNRALHKVLIGQSLFVVTVVGGQ
ncbi:hypothetical protein D3C87_1303360 [compost metagenome]